MLGNLFGGEQRAISYQRVWGSGNDFIPATESGTFIDDKTALRINAFFACVLLISDTISTLPLDCYIRRDGERYPYRPKPSWVDQPDVDLLKSEHYQQVILSLLIDGNSFTRIYRDTQGNVANLVCLDPFRVVVQRNNLTREPEYVIDDDRANPVPKKDMIHLTEMRKAGQLRGVSRVVELRENLGLGSAMQSFAARFFGQGAVTAGVIEMPGAATAEQARELVDGFAGRHSGFTKAHKIGVLTNGARFNRTGVNPDEAQMLESRKLAIEEVARIFRVPPHMIGISTSGAMSYSSVEQQNINFVTHTLRPYIAKLEEGYSRLLPQLAFIRWNVDGLLRGDFQTRMQGYSIGMQAGFISVNDVHRFEDWKPVEGGDAYRVSLANIDIMDAEVVALDKKIAMAQKLVQVGYEPEAVLKALDLPIIAHTGLPSTQLQAVAQIDPQNPEAVYPA